MGGIVSVFSMIGSIASAASAIGGFFGGAPEAPTMMAPPPPAPQPLAPPVLSADKNAEANAVAAAAEKSRDIRRRTASTSPSLLGSLDSTVSSKKLLGE